MLSLTRNPHIPLTIRKKIGKCRAVAAGQDFRIGMFGQNYEGTTGIHLDDKVYLYGLHEAATVRLMRRILERQRKEGLAPVYMDVGANTGMHLIAAAGLADRAYGFEPWDKVRKRAERNIALNNLSHVTVFPFGLSDTDAELPFRPPANNNLGIGMFVAEQDSSTLILKVRNGDSVVKENNIRPTLIKMDIEGHEKAALTGLRETLRRYKPAVIFEYSASSRKDLGDLNVLKELFGEDYQFHGIRRSREMPSLEPFNPAKKYENVLAVTAAP